jgi:Amt family ammonium transporter
VSFEALVRWTHPKLGIIPPDRFITMAEENGLIVPLGSFVMEQACQMLRRLRSLPGGANLSMNVNISRRQVVEPDFAPALQALIEEQSIPPSCLRLEITESIVMTSEDSIAASLEALKALGTQIYMDDFGTGLSSLGLLRKLPLDGIKIDRCFIETADSDRESIAILHAIINLGHNLGMSVTAEGIEKPEQVATILAMECDLVQGYLFGRPAPPEEAEKLLDKMWGEFIPNATEQWTAATP